MHKYLTKFSIVFIGLSLLLSGCVDTEQKRNLIQSIPFDKQKWLGLNSKGIREAEIESEYRPGMARNLIDRKVLIAKSRAEIIEILGDYGGDGFNIPMEVRYGLEDIYGRNIDPIAIEYLKITFNGEDKVGKAEIEFYKTGDWSGS